MDLMTLAAKIVLDDKSFTQGIKETESAGQRLAGHLSSMSVAVGNIVTDMVRNAYASIKNVVDGSIGGYADYQQLIGGVETLFKNSAGKVEKYAQESYKTTGLSANEYMETVTSFSASLLQGLKGNTEAAADVANLALTDMADNANKMGSDMSSIQNAYMGFAKQNYTMLDNLKLGYGGTQSEMVRLVNDSHILDHEIKNLDGITFDQLIMAIHEIQTNMGVTGTTAKEAAETISGSKASLKAAWEDLMAAVGGAGNQERLDETVENFKKSFSAYITNFLPTLVKTINNSGTLVEAIADSLVSIPTDALTEVADGAVNSGTQMINSVTKISHWLIESLSTMLGSISSEDVAELGVAIGNFFGSAILDLAEHLPENLLNIARLGISLAGGLIEGLFKGLFGEGAEVDKIAEQLGDSLSGAELDHTKAGAIIKYMDDLYQKGGLAATKTTEWQEAVKALDEVLPGAGDTVDKYGEHVGLLIDKLKMMNEEQRNSIILNALGEATEKELRLLTTQTMDREKARAQKERAESAQQTYSESMRNNIMQYAGTAADTYWGNTHDESGNVIDVFDEGYYNDLRSLSEGVARVGEEIVNLDDANFDQLSSIASFIGDDELLKSIKDEKDAYDQATKEVEEADKEIGRLDKEIEATETELRNTEEAAARAAESLIHLNNAYVTAADEMFAMRDKMHQMGYSGNASFMPEATGIENVPYNGFKAALHKGEMILTAAEAKRYRSGEGSVNVAALENAIVRAVRDGMAGVTVNSYLDGKRVTQAVNQRNTYDYSARRFAP